MKKKTFILFPLLAMFLSSCLFDTDDDGLSSWLSDQGMPSSYKVQMVTVNDLKPTSAELFKDSLPRSAGVFGTFGASAGMVHDAVFDFAVDSAFLADLKAADSAKSYLSLYLFDAVYWSKVLPSTVLPIEDEVNVNISWTLSEKLTDAELNALETVVDSEWIDGLKSWKTKKTADTTVSVSITKKDSVLVLDLPSAFIDDVRKNSGNRRLQLRVSAPEAPHAYRFYGPSVGLLVSPILYMVEMEKDSYRGYRSLRAATLISNREECSDCLVLHGGVKDSLLVEFPSKPIMKALSDFYGDEFPYDAEDVRQSVVMAQVTFYRDDSKGSNELDMPIAVEAFTYTGDKDSLVCSRDNYSKYNDSLIAEKGHPNLVFHDGDSLTLQVTTGMRDFINRASDGRSFKMKMVLDRSLVLDKDEYFYGSNSYYVNSKGDSVRVFFPYPDYARYDFSSIKNTSTTLKLWLASKRGEEK